MKILRAFIFTVFAVLVANASFADDLDSATKSDSYSKNARQEKNLLDPTQEDAKTVQKLIVEHAKQSAEKAIVEVAPQSVPVPNEPPAESSAKSEQKNEQKQTNIVAEQLPDIAGDSAGIADGAKNLGANLWQNTSYGTALRLVQGLPTSGQSGVMNDLRTRVLLTAAEPPRKNLSKSEQSAGLLEQRLQKLWANGDFENYAVLADVVPHSRQKPDWQKNLAIIKWSNGDDKGGCDSAEQAMTAASGNDVDLAKIKIYCAILRGQNDAANLAFDLWREKNAASDPIFVNLIDNMIHDAKKTPIAAKSMSMLHWVIAKKAGVAITAAGGDVDDWPTLRLAAQNPGVDIAVRIEWNEKLAIAGKISPAQLAAIYADHPNTKPDADKKSKLSPVLRRIAAWQNIKSLDDTAARANALHDNLFVQDIEEQDRKILSILAASWINEMSPQADLVWFAPDAVRILIAAGQFAIAKPWMELAAADDTAASKLWPYLRAMKIVDSASVRGKSLLEKWVAYDLVANPKNLESHLGLLAAMIRAVGDSEDIYNRNLLPGGYSSEAVKLFDKKSPSASFGLILSQAVQNFSRGEGILMCDYAISGAPMRQLSPQTAAACVEALAKMGLQIESRQLAIEFFAANGL